MVAHQSALARFVGIEAYEAAGGVARRVISVLLSRIGTLSKGYGFRGQGHYCRGGETAHQDFIVSSSVISREAAGDR